MQILLYGNGGSGNHGCEAIVRGTQELLHAEMIIQSIAPEEDKKYALTEFAEINNALSNKRSFLEFAYAYLKLKITKDYTDMDGIAYLSAIRKAKGRANIALSVGGDNYCYGGTEIYAYLNKAYHKQGMKTVLWGCSVEPDVVAEPKVAKDLQRYNLVVTRESITYEAIKKVNNNTILAPDPAFYMKPKECLLDERFESKNIIGINVSPMIVSNESVAGITYENYKVLITYILDNTDSYIALVPHVVWESNDDRTVLRKLYEEFNGNKRLILVEDHTAPELKYIISKCRMFIGARTHATIAAYSSCVPTLVVGYSVKARGIARDLFGTEDGYVLPVQNLQNENDLTEAFTWLASKEDAIKTHLMEFIPKYSGRGIKAVEALKKL